MAKTTAEIQTELVFYQCCLADLAYKYVKKEQNGHQDLACILNKLTYGVLLLEALRCPARILSLEQMTQEEIEEQLEKLSDLCSCPACEDNTTITDDTL